MRDQGVETPLGSSWRQHAHALPWLLLVCLLAAAPVGALAQASIDSQRCLSDPPPAPPTKIVANPCKGRGTRVVELGVASAKLGRVVGVRVLLPPDYYAQPTRKWPVLYLLHGVETDEQTARNEVNYKLWTDRTNIVATTAKHDVLVVMPEGGDVGFYSDWRRQPWLPQRWESFHTSELPDLIDQTFRSAGQKRAIAGLSMGGLGAAYYALSHPGMFQAVATFSGLLHPSDYWPVVHGALAIKGFDTSALWGDGNPLAWGNTQNTLWKQHDPYRRAAELAAAHVPFFVSAGNGWGANGTFDVLESGAHDASHDFVLGFEAAGGSVVRDFYGNGTHSWPFWDMALAHAWCFLSGHLGAGLASTASVDPCLPTR